MMSVPAVGFVNGLCFASSGAFLVAALGQVKQRNNNNNYNYNYNYNYNSALHPVAAPRLLGRLGHVKQTNHHRIQGHVIIQGDLIISRFNYPVHVLHRARRSNTIIIYVILCYIT